jgi:hypothetical protein
VTLIRKIIIVLVGVSLAVLVTVLLLNPTSIEALARSLSEASALIRVPLAILLDILVLAVLFVLVRNERSTYSNGGLMVKGQGVVADVSVESACDRILRAVRAVPDVLSAEAKVQAVHGKADIDLTVAVASTTTNLPEKQREIDRALRQVINKQLGLQMAGKPRVHIRMDEEKTVEKEKAPEKILSPEPPPAPAVIAEPLHSETIHAPEIIAEVEAPKPADTVRGDREEQLEPDSAEQITSSPDNPSA